MLMSLETEKSSQQIDGGLAVNESPLAFNEVSKLFSMPIAEAASILGVSTGALKKICRDNGLVRWPYRKESAKSQEGVPLAGQPSQSQQQGNKILHHGRHDMFHSYQPKNIPNYLDEFKHGFPTNGLSSISNIWWGTSSSDSTEGPTVEEAEKHKPGEAWKDVVMTEDKPERETEKGYTGVASLLSLRKRSAEEGRTAVKLGVTRGYGPYKLNTKGRLMLIQVFRSSYPSQWR